MSMKPTEADTLAQNPMFIGLISMLTGSTDLEMIRIVSRRLYDRGRDILGVTSETITKKAA
jgi:hypothetical protein